MSMCEDIPPWRYEADKPICTSCTLPVSAKLGISEIAVLRYLEDHIICFFFHEKPNSIAVITFLKKVSYLGKPTVI